MNNSKLIPVSISTFSEFATKAGQAKANIVRTWKYKPSYTPALDFYKDLREAIPDFCRRSITKGALEELVSESGSKKKEHYESALQGFLKWKKTKSGMWRTPDSGSWVQDRVSVKVAPEIGYESDGVTYFVKLYFNRSKLTKFQADVILEIMASSLLIRKSTTTMVSVLDVKQAKEFSASGSRPAMQSLLRAESAYWSTMWDSI